MTTREPPLRSEEPPSGAVFWVLSAIGSAMILFGIYGVVHDQARIHPASYLKILVGGLLVHDLLVAPAIILVGVVLRRAVPGRVRGPVQAALAISAVLALVSVPVIGGYGRLANNPSVLYSHHYTRALVVLVAIVGAGAALAMARGARVRRDPDRPSPRPSRGRRGRTPR